MERMQTRFIIAVTTRLAAAEDTNAKAELIEELSENLYQRYLDLVSSGMAEEAAYAAALEDLGDVEELLAYLRSLGPDGTLPRQEDPGRDVFSDFLRSAEDIVRETISQTRDAVDQARDIVKGVAEKLREKYPNGFQGGVHVHFGDADDHGEHPAGEDHEEDEPCDGWSFSMGYNKDRGFFCERGQSQPVSGTVLPSRDLRGVDIKLYNGDVTLRLADDPQADLVLEGDTDQLELRLSNDGILSIRQGRTASASFLFTRGLAAADVELYLPRRLWPFLQVCAVNGDVTIASGLEAEELVVKTNSGDLEASSLSCRHLVFRSSSGDLRADGRLDTVSGDSISGDIDLSGQVSSLQANTVSGDVQFAGSIREAKAASVSGDVILSCRTLPERAELASKSGDVELSVPDGQGFSLQYSRASGDMESEFPLTGALGGKSGSAIYLDGGGSAFRLSSASGDIALRKS